MIFFVSRSPSTVKIETDETLVLRKLVDVYSFFEFKQLRQFQFGKPIYKPQRSTRNVITVLGTFKIGLFFDVYKTTKTILEELYARNQIPEQEIVIDPKILDLVCPIKNIQIDQSIPIKLVDLPNKEFKYFDGEKDQTEAMAQIFKFGRGIIVAPCSSGKSCIIAGVLHTFMHSDNIKPLPGSFLVLVPNRQLVTQLYGDFIEYGITDCEMFTSGENHGLMSKIIISNRSWLNHHFNELPEISLVFADEVHSISPNNVGVKYVRDINTPFKIGCTATPPDKPYNKNMLIGLFGSILMKAKYCELERLRKLTININLLNFEYNNRSKEIRELYNLKPHLVTKRINLADGIRNEIEHFMFGNNGFVIKTVIDKVRGLSGNTLVLFDYLAIKDKITEFIHEDIADRVHYVYGNVKIAKREEIRHLFEQNTNQILIAQVQCFGVGINIKNIDNIMFLFTSKASTRIIQALGRGLRQKEGKEVLNVYDVISNLKYARKHLAHRSKMYKEHIGVEKAKIINIPVVSSLNF